MRYCPKCRSEYQDWVKTCIDCGSELTDKLPAKPPAAVKPLDKNVKMFPANTFNYPDEEHSGQSKVTSRAAGLKKKSGKIVTLLTFTYPAEAHLSRAKLESAGIWCYVADESLVSANQFFSTALSGVKLRVRESDVEEALRILERIPEVVPESGESDEENCPQCHSKDIQYETFPLRWVFLSIFLLGFPLLFLKRKWKCKNCGNEWQ
jgi:hypothetical protein